MKKITQEEVSLLFENYGCKLLGNYVGCGVPVEYECKCGKIGKISLDKLKVRIKRKEGCRYCSHHEWTKEQDDILKKMYGVEPRKVISEALGGISLASIKSRAATLKLNGNRSGVISKARKGVGKKYSFDDSFFSRKSLKACYWAGFLAADGCVLDSKNTVSVRLHEQDKYHLEQFQDDSCHTGVIHDVSKANQVLLQFHSASKWIEDLAGIFSVTPRKSLTLQPPCGLTESQAIAFIVGYIDGHGSLSNKGQSSNYCVQIYGTESLMLWIKSWFDKWYPPLNKRVANVTSLKKIYRYALFGARAKFIIEKLLSIELPRLGRKWDYYKNQIK